MSAGNPELLLYGGPVSPFSMRIVLQAGIKGLPLQVAEPPGGLKSAAYLAINPLGKIPALVCEDGALPESAVIAEYLEELFPEPPLLPSGAWPRARVRLLIRLADTYVMDAMLPVFAQLDPAQRDATAVRETLAKVETGLGHLDAFVAPGPHACGDSRTLADCALVPILKYCAFFFPLFGADDPLPRQRNLARYWSAVQGDAVFAAGLRQMDAAIAAALAAKAG